MHQYPGLRLLPSPPWCGAFCPGQVCQARDPTAVRTGYPPAEMPVLGVGSAAEQAADQSLVGRAAGSAAGSAVQTLDLRKQRPRLPGVGSVAGAAEQVADQSPVAQVAGRSPEQVVAAAAGAAELGRNPAWAAGQSLVGRTAAQAAEPVAEQAADQSLVGSVAEPAAVPGSAVPGSGSGPAGEAAAN